MNDKKIIKSFKRAMELGCNTISAETISVYSGIPRNKVYKKLNSLEKFGDVKLVLIGHQQKKWKLRSDL